METRHPRWRHPSSAAVCLALAVGALPAPAWSQSNGRCNGADVDRELDRELDQRARNPELAAVHVRALLARCPTPRVRAQVGFDEQGARHWREAFPLLRDALASSGDPWVISQRARLERALQEVEQHLPRLSPQTNVPGAELRVDGTSVGRLPLSTPWVLASGSGAIELSAPGFRPLRRTVSLADGDVFREMLTLAPAAPTPVAAESSVVARPVAPPAAAAPSGRRGPGAGPWIVAGTGVAVTAMGGIFWALREGAVGNCAVESDALACPTAADAARAEGAAGMGLAANVSLGVGIAGMVGGALWLLLGRSAERPASSVRVGVTTVRDGGQLVVGGAF